MHDRHRPHDQQASDVALPQGMLVVETIAKIRRAHFVDGKSIKQICRELRLSRNTVRKVILLALHEQFHVGRGYQPHFVAVPLRHPAPMVRRGAGLHRHDARWLIGKKRRQPRPRQSPVV